MQTRQRHSKTSNHASKEKNQQSCQANHQSLPETRAGLPQQGKKLANIQRRSETGSATQRLNTLQRRADAGKARRSDTAFVGRTIQRAPVIQCFNSVWKSALESAIATLHPDWTKGTDERTITVWEIGSVQKWDFHFSAIFDPTGNNMTKFHFTIRNGKKGDDAFAWFNVVGHNSGAVVGNRENAGNDEYYSVGSADYRKIARKIRRKFASIDNWADAIVRSAAAKSA